MVCPVCGRPVEQSGGRGRPRKYHQPECQAVALAEQRVAQIQRKAARRRGLLPPVAPKDPPAALKAPKVSTGRGDPKKRRKAVELMAKGHTLAEVGTKAGLSAPTVRAIARQEKSTPGSSVADERAMIFAPVLSDEAARALEDFGYFRQRYFGRVPTPWQIEAGDRLKDYLASPEKEFVVLNAPPGSGKSSLFVHDLVCWLACRDRTVRVLVGSRTYRQAVSHTARLRRTFSRVTLAPVDSDDVKRGLAVEPTSTLVKDFGRFQPLGRADMWAANEFVLVQPDGVAVSEKEASFAAYGMDSGFLGGRFDVVVWDDLVDSKTLRTPEGRDQLVRLYEDEMETRVEPGGLLLLQGQRMAADDLYRHALNMRTGDPHEIDDFAEDDRPVKYHHIVYRAHDDGRCRGPETHRAGAPAWPDGCLLDPLRLPWHELVTIRANRAEKFQVLYQQEDVDPANVLVPRIWIDGGRDVETGEQHPGCWDRTRGIAEIPTGLVPPLYSIATADPSAAKFWAIQWWAYHPATEQRFLLDQVRQKLDAPEFLDFDYAGGVHTGVMEEWQVRSQDLGLPIVRWIVEANSAQRFLLQYDHVRTWQAKHKVSITPHQTQRNSLDKDLGVQSIAQHYRFGRVRLPAGGLGDLARRMVQPLVDEVTRWPDSATDDCTMAHWFLEWHLPRLWPKRVAVPVPARRPSWMRERAGAR
jgi:hypothetical protein